MADGTAASTLDPAKSSPSATLYTQPKLLDPSAVAAQETQALEANKKSRAAALSVTDQQIKDLGPPPDFTPTTYQPAKQTSPIQQWGSIAMVAATLLPLISRSSLTTALNAAGNVMKAFRQGDQEAANFAYQQWKDANDEALKKANYALDLYKTILGEYYNNENLIEKISADNEATIVSEFQGQHLAIGDISAQAKAIESGAAFSVPQFNDWVVKFEGIVRNWEDASAGVPGQFDDVHAANSDLKALTEDPNWTSKTPTQQRQDIINIAQKHPYFANQLQAYGGIPDISTAAASPPPKDWKGQWTGSDAQWTASAIINGDQPPTLTGLYGGAKQVRSQLAQQGFDLTRATEDYTAQLQLLKTVNQQSIQKQRAAIVFLQQGLDKVDQLAQQWGGGNIPAVNAARQFFASQGLQGEDLNKQVNLFKQQVIDMTAEIATVFRQGNTPTDDTLKLAQQELSTDMPLDTFLASVDLLRTNMQYRLNSLQLVAGSAPLGTPMDNPYTQAPPTEGGPKQAETQADVDALPPGTAFVWTDGQTYTKN